MKASELVQKLHNKFLGKKETKPATVQPPLVEKALKLPLMDKLGVIELHEHWRN